ncbi:MAG: DNA-3-methyladenine glycosylase I [Bacteroidales bacterium]|jgi:DNA-3-methyladenine glycosylase I
MKNRCPWPKEDELMIKYHDEEWGVPLHDDTKLFEFFVLDAFQAGLSWKTVLHKRGNFRKAFANYDVKKIAKFDDAKVQKLLSDEGIIRNKLKITSTIENAKAFIKVQKEFGSFDTYIWQFVGNKTIVNKWKTLSEIPASTKESDLMSKELKNRGFKFVGSTICYAFMQAAGLVNDHMSTCPRYKLRQV